MTSRSQTTKLTPIGLRLREKYPDFVPVALDLSHVQGAKHCTTSRTPSLTHRLLLPANQPLLSSLFRYLSHHRVLPESSPALIGLNYLIECGTAKIFVTGSCQAEIAWCNYAQHGQYLLPVVVYPENVFG